MKKYLFVITFLTFPLSVSSATVHVPSGQPTIQAGIDFASTGDTILVADGIFTGDGNRDIDFAGKAVVLRSANGAEGTTIDCQGSYGNYHRGFIIQTGEDSSTVIIGFKIIGGFRDRGGAVACVSSSPVFRDCIFENNSVDLGLGLLEMGGAVICSEGSPTFINCSFLGNSARTGGSVKCAMDSALFSGCIFVGNSAVWGGAVSFYGSNAIFTDCLFFGNEATSYGGALQFSFGAPIIRNCTIVDNSAYDQSRNSGGAAHVDNLALVEFENCIIANNFSSKGSAISCGELKTADPPSLSCTNIYGNEGGDWIGCIADQIDSFGNISVDPGFCDTAAGDFRLESGSPCTPENNQCGTLIGAFGVGCSTTDILGGSDVRLPSDFILSQNYPNPFNPSTIISYSLPTRSDVSITVYNLLGQLITTLLKSVQPAGSHTVVWDGTDLNGRPVATGIYVYRIQTDSFTSSRKMILLK